MRFFFQIIDKNFFKASLFKEGIFKKYTVFFQKSFKLKINVNNLENLNEYFYRQKVFLGLNNNKVFLNHVKKKWLPQNTLIFVKIYFLHYFYDFMKLIILMH